MLRRIGRFVLYHLSPDAGSRAAWPASITYCSTGDTEAVTDSEGVAGESGEAGGLDGRYGSLAPGAGFGAAFVALWAGIAGGFLDVGRVVDRRRVAAALERLDPPDREILELSFRLPAADAALASLRQCAVPEFARRRAGAVERLLGDLGVERDEDLGCVLEAMLDPKTWVGLDRAGQSVGGHLLRLAAHPQPLRVSHAVTPNPAEVPAAGAAMTGLVERRAGPAQRGTSLAPWRVSRTEIVAPPRPREKGRARARLARNRIAAIGVVAAAVLATAGLAAARFGGGEQGSGRTGDHGATSGQFVARRVAAVGAPFPSEPGGSTSYPTAYIRRATVLFDKPGGRPEVKIPVRTDWGSPRVLSVVGQEGGWLGVLAPELGNGEVGWLEADGARLDSVAYSLHVDLSRRELTVHHGGRSVRRIPVAVGAPPTPTPTGRFAVTDKLEVTDRGSPYGCCVLVLTAHQKKLPRDWPGGDRLAVHSTHNATAIGHAVSLGCMRATFHQARWLMKTIPLGTPVFIRR